MFVFVFYSENTVNMIFLYSSQWGNFKNHSSGAHQSINENKYKTQNQILILNIQRENKVKC